MNIFSVNQVNHVYVAKALKTVSDTPATDVLTTAGDIAVRSADNGCQLYFQHMGAGGITRSDLIDINNIMWAKKTPAKNMAYKLKVATVTLADTVNDGDPIPGQDYILRIEFNGYIGISPEDSQYWKYASVHATNNMSASDFYKAMAVSLANNMSREATPIIKVFVGATEVTPGMKVTDIAGTAASVIIKEVEPDWILGTKQQRRINFKVVPTEVDVVEGSTTHPYTWGEVAYSDGDTITNGKLMADYEYFFMGERGDQYRMVSFPDYVPTTYLVDPSLTYDIITIHYAYTGANESVQKSEKDITLICYPAVTAGLKTAINALISDPTKQVKDAPEKD